LKVTRDYWPMPISSGNARSDVGTLNDVGLSLITDNPTQPTHLLTFLLPRF
jgi:hypothetical protein